MMIENAVDIRTFFILLKMDVFTLTDLIDTLEKINASGFCISSMLIYLSLVYSLKLYIW